MDETLFLKVLFSVLVITPILIKLKYVDLALINFVKLGVIQGFTERFADIRFLISGKASQKKKFNLLRKPSTKQFKSEVLRELQLNSSI